MLLFENQILPITWYPNFNFKFLAKQYFFSPSKFFVAFSSGKNKDQTSEIIRKSFISSTWKTQKTSDLEKVLRHFIETKPAILTFSSNKIHMVKMVHENL